MPVITARCALVLGVNGLIGPWLIRRLAEVLVGMCKATAGPYIGEWQAAATSRSLSLGLEA